MQRKPSWLKVSLPSGENFNKINSLLSREKLHTICQEALCPNRAECWSKGTATFLILGDICTRYCSYCNVKTGKPGKLDLDEPEKIAKLVKKLNLRYSVITSVTRDDLGDGGADVFYKTIIEIKKLNSNCKVEILTPEFKREGDIKKILNAKPYVFAHNMEVTERLFSKIRPQGNYKLSLMFLKKIKEINENQLTKSGIMAGLGETKEEIIKTMHDLRKVKCDIFTIGQYLQPTKKHAAVQKYYTPTEFKEFERVGYGLGFKLVNSGPLVRSSYHAEGSLPKTSN